MLALMCHFKCKNLVGELLSPSPATPPSAAAAKCLQREVWGRRKKRREKGAFVCLRLSLGGVWRDDVGAVWGLVEVFMTL